MSITQIGNLVKQFNDSPSNKIIQNAITMNDLRTLAVNWSATKTSDETVFSEELAKISITDQKSSGRCWLFAALNVLRRYVIADFNLPADFELSQSYLFFWDKFHRFEYNLNVIATTADLDLDDRSVHRILSEPLSDGGQWDMVMNLVNAHGVVPKVVFQETYHSSNSGALNALLTRKFREAALEVRRLISLKQDHKIHINGVMQTVFNILCMCLGTPPIGAFNWSFYDAQHKHNTLSFDSPLHFYDRFKTHFDETVCLVNDPRHAEHELLTVQYLGNMIEGRPVRYLNVSMDVMRRAAAESIKRKNAVWFGCDVGKEILDTFMCIDVKQYNLLLQTTFGMSKRDRMLSGESQMTHAMVFSGFHADANGKIKRWQVENSWGPPKTGVSPNSYVMTDDWFTEHMFEIVVKKDCLDKETLDAWNTAQAPTVLPIWDPMGSLAKRRV